MPLNSNELDRILRAGDVGGVVTFFDGAPEADRRPLAGHVSAWQKLLETNAASHYLSETALKKLGAFDIIADVYILRPAAYAAALACADIPQIRTVRYAHASENLLVEILDKRRPSWLQAYADGLLDRELNSRSFDEWWLVRAMLKAGLCRPPAHDNYALGALVGIGSRLSQTLRMRKGAESIRDETKSPTLADMIADQHDWLETAFWRLFEVDGTGEVNLASIEKYSGVSGAWAEALAELGRRGVLSRARLLDASLAALSRDFIQFRAGWFSRFHELLNPTSEERVARADRYLDLLSSSIAPTVSFALAAIEVIDGETPLAGARLLSALEPVLHARAKGTVLAALKLLERAAVRDPGERDNICTVATSALLQESPDVQKAVFGLIERHGRKLDSRLRDRLSEFAGAVVPSLRKRLDAWLGGTSASVVSVSSVSSVSVNRAAVPRARSRLERDRALVSVDTFDDLLDLAGKVLESPDDPHDIERLLDGLSRLCDRVPEDFARRVGPLRKRILKKFADKNGAWIRVPTAVSSVGGVFMSWIDSKAFLGSVRDDEFAPGVSDFGFWTVWEPRLCELSERVCSRIALPMLSTPTHRGGWIDPAVLRVRWTAWKGAGATPSVDERALALRRLAGEDAEPMRRLLIHAEPMIDATSDHALDVEWRPFIETRSIQGQTFSSLRVDLSCAGDEPVSDLRPAWGRSDSTSADLIRWWPLFEPGNLEPFFLEGAGRMVWSMDYSEVSDRETALYLEPLTDPFCALGPMACLLLALGLAACGTDLRGRARDALIAVISDGRLNAELLGATQRRLIETGANCFGRWAKSLRETARVSPTHRDAISDLFQRTLSGDPEKTPRDLAALLELLVELLCENGKTLEYESTRAYLSRLTTGGKVGKLAKQLLKT